ncbi:MAG: phenylalanine--tRNA ligase subunit alpha [Gemmatimonadota bacterium]|nr:MAG: phenylalanine--tRNA ligase subunit alpha [Gemmatimonadota bacterium]
MPQTPAHQEQLDAVAHAVDRASRADAATLAQLKTEILGRKAGTLTLILRSLAGLPSEERRAIGARANQLKRALEEAIAQRELALQQEARAPKALDWTMPSRPVWRGAVHPVNAVTDEICEVFRTLGFTRVTGPEAETEDYNFTKLNIGLDHPAADEHDTFYLGPGVLLRTHTSPMQARVMEQYQPPIRIVVPGRVYRRDAFDPSHSPVFEQIEGLAVDEGISFVDFKAAIDTFVKLFFSRDTAVRFRPSFFPFTEPSAEVDAQCQMCRGSGCSTCKQTGWLEIMGAGMVHPAVFENCGIDPERYTGYAFGMGVERIAMLRHGIPDIRLLWENDMRLLSQFSE